MKPINSVDSQSPSKKRTVESDRPLPFEQKKPKTHDMVQLQNDIQALREEVQALKLENQLLKNQRTSFKLLPEFNQELNAELNSRPGVDVSSDNLPAVVLRQIFDNITDARTLAGCRGVCTSWKTLIDSTPALMRRLTFLILHPRFFLDLSNIAHRVRSISLRHILPSTEEDLQALIRAISPTLESVGFDFDIQVGYSGVRPDHHARLVSLILQQCTKLKELRILGKQKDFLQGLNSTEPAFTRITSLTINTLNHRAHDTFFSRIILSLSALATLNLFHNKIDYEQDFDFENESKFSTPICAHILQYPGVLRKFTYLTSRDSFVSGTLGSDWTRLFLLAGRHGIVVVTDKSFDLNRLCMFQETAEQKVNLVTCSAITNATLQTGANQNAHRSHLCVNVEQLLVHLAPVDHHATLGQLSILWQLKKLRKLSLAGWQPIGMFPQAVVLPPEALPQFAQGIATVRALTLSHNVFGSTDVFASLHL